jgi:two-component system CheB/CheR fusion protein
MPAKKHTKRRKGMFPQQRAQGAGELPLAVVGIGTSAGTLADLLTFFEQMPAGSGLAFVVVPHVMRDYQVLPQELLAKHTPLSVHTAENDLPVAPDCIYCSPTDAIVTIAQGRLSLVRMADARLHRPIDQFLRSLAEAQGERGIGVILSGTGSDGTLGLRAIKEHGGITLVQDPTSTAHAAMPEHAIASGMVDQVLLPEQMPERLVAYAQRLGRGTEPAAGDTVEAYLGEICSILQRAVHHDFTQYKRTTLLRRIDRRMLLLQIDTLEDYTAVLAEDAEEQRRLFKDLLITITSFFRDPDTFAELAKILRRIIEEPRKPERLRVWVSGCATGEEAYSLAILAREQMARAERILDVQIFATDIDDRSLEIARAGRYPASIAEQVSAERLERFFTRQSDGSGYQVTKELRSMCIFSAHDVTADPPFSAMDLVSCRNLLIYLERALQDRILPLFHYALRPGGYLCLGPAESIGRHGALFRTVDKRHHIFQARDVTRRAPLIPAAATRSPVSPGSKPPVPAPGPARQLRPDIPILHQRATIEALGCKSVLIDESGRIIDVCGRLGSYLEIAWGPLGNALPDLSRADLRAPLRMALHKALKTGDGLVVRNLSVRGGNQPVRFDLLIQRFPYGRDESDLWMVMFRELEPAVPEVAPGPADAIAPADPRARALEDELTSLKEHLQATVEELESSNEELKTSNEELLSMNEELQSANAELQTAKQELQSVNEELESVNRELAAKVGELDRAQADMRNLFQSTRIPIVFLDKRLHIQQLTPAAAEILRLSHAEPGTEPGADHGTRPGVDPGSRPGIGRFIGDIAMRVEPVDLVRECKAVLDELAPREILVRQGASEGRTEQRYLLRILPYRTLTDVIDGVLLTFVDVTEVEHVHELAVRRAKQQAGVARLGLRALSGTNLDALCDEAVALVYDSLDVEHVALFELARRRDELRLRAGIGWPPGVVGTATVPVGPSSQAGYTLRVGEPVAVTELGEETRFTPSRLLLEQGIRSGITCVIQGGGRRPFGVLGAHTREPRVFDQEDVDFLQAIANALGSARARQRVLDKLRDSEQRARRQATELQSIYENSAVGLGVFDRRLCYVSVNPVLAAMNGLPPAAHIGKTPSELMPAQAEHVEPIMQQVLATGQPVLDVENTGYTRAYGKEERTWRSSFAPIRGASGEVEAVSVVVNDITAQKRAEQQIRDSEQRLFRALKHAPLPLCILAEDGEFLLVSDVWFALTGYTAEEIPDLRSWLMRAFEAAADGVHAYVHALFENEEPHHGDALAVRTKGGEERLWEFSSAPMGRARDGRRLRISMARDVTEEEHARRQLIESEQRFRTMADSAPVLIWMTGTDKLCTWFNRGWLDYRGRTLEQEQGNGWAEGIHPDDLERCQHTYDWCFERREPFEIEYRLRRYDGVYRWILDRGVPRHDGSGAFAGYIGSGLDITDRREAEAAMERSQRWLERITAASPDVIAVHDATTGRLVYANREIGSILGYTIEDLEAMGDGVGRLVHPDDLPDVERLYQEMRANPSNEVRKYVHRLRHANGTYRWLEVRVVPFERNQAGEILQSLIIARDVTEIRSAEQALRESESRFRRAVLDAPLPMMLHAEDGEILAVSDSLLAATGYARDMIGNLDDWLRLAHGPDAEAVHARIRQAFASADAQVPHELPVRIQSGAIRRWLYHVSAPQALPDGRRYCIELAVDVTELRAAQQALEESGRQKDNFLAMLGHELRNPLAAIRHVTEMLELHGADEEQLARLRKVLDRQTQQMARLIDGLLDVSRIVRGKLRLERQTIDLMRVLSDVLEDRRADIEAAGMALDIDLAGTPLHVRGDPTRLAQVFDNLLGNAVKFTEAPGLITVTARRHGETARVLVHDTGIGIDPELKEHIFEPFQQAPQSLERAAGGLGLGLSLVKGLIELHGGTVSADSEGPGKGTTFTIELPLVTAPVVPAPSAAVLPPHPVSILIVEDNEDTADLLGELLRVKGHHAVVAHTGTAGLAMAQREHPDVILCDLGLPEMSGYDVARAIRSDATMADIWLVALSGYGQQKDRQHSKEAGFDAHLTKPVDLAAIDAVLGQFRTARTSHQQQ